MIRPPGPVAGDLGDVDVFFAGEAADGRRKRWLGCGERLGVRLRAATGAGAGPPGFSGWAAAEAPSAGSIVATVAPTATVSPSLTAIRSTPVPAAGMSLVALSVSSSKSGSPARTRDPSGLSQRARIPSVIDSPTEGTVTGTEGMVSLLLARLALSTGFLLNARGGDQVRHGQADGGFDELGLLAVVDELRAGRRAGAGVAADVLRRRLRAALRRRGATNVQAPMFCDSSWTQTHSRADW